MKIDTDAAAAAAAAAAGAAAGAAPATAAATAANSPACINVELNDEVLGGRFAPP